MSDVTYDRPVKATLHVHLENSETWKAGPRDLAKFRLLSRDDAYRSVRQAWSKTLADHDLLDDAHRDLVDTELNPMRALLECVLLYPSDEEDTCDHQGVAELERRLRALRAAEEAAREQTNSAYVGKPLADIIDDFATTRGDLSEASAREQLAQAVLVSAEALAARGTGPLTRATC